MVPSASIVAVPIPAARLAASPAVFGAAGIGGPGSAAWLAVQESKNAPRQAHGIANRPGKARDQVIVIVWQRPKEGGSLIAGALLALWTVSERPSGPAGLAPNPCRVAAGRSPAWWHTVARPAGTRDVTGRSPPRSAAPSTAALANASSPPSSRGYGGAKSASPLPDRIRTCLTNSIDGGSRTPIAAMT